MRYIQAVGLSAPDTLCVKFTSGEFLFIPTSRFPRLHGASAEQINTFRISAGGRAVHWEELNEDIHVCGFLNAAYNDDKSVGDS